MKSHDLAISCVYKSEQNDMWFKRQNKTNIKCNTNQNNINIGVYSACKQCMLYLHNVCNKLIFGEICNSYT